MADKKEAIPDWVSEEIQNAKFGKSKKVKSPGYILEIYEQDAKLEIQLDDAIEDGRHIITVDLDDAIKIAELERGLLYSFEFEQQKAPLGEKVVQYLQQEQDLDMQAIYQFKLYNLEKIDES